MTNIPMSSYLCEGDRCSKNAAIPYDGKKLCIRCYRKEEKQSVKVKKEQKVKETP